MSPVVQCHFTHLCYAPTMRTPGTLDPYSINAYLAMRGALLSARRAGCTHLAVPLLCHGSGEMPVTMVLHQIRRAYESVVVAGPLPREWRAINHDHATLTDTATTPTT